MKFTTFLLSGIVIIDLFNIFVATQFTAIVDTTSGPVQGEIINSDVNSVIYASFKGIRYAKAPVGYLRFKPPVAVDPWTETVKAVTEGDDCPQIDFTTKAVRGSEDCLFINVYTPVTDLSETPQTLRSVMVWIYGGGFTTGTSSFQLYNPEYLLKKNVVFVSMNYRLGALGFLSLNHPNVTGNAGLKDQVLALKWVQENIVKFGGNPNNVTIFGASAGSASVGSHVLSDASIGLFHGVIGMSSVPLNPRIFMTRAKAMSQAIKLGALIGTNSTDKNTLIKAFYNATMIELVEATSKLTKIFPSFSLTVEDERIATDVFLSKCALVKYFTGNFTKVPQILGFMDQEAVSIFPSFSLTVEDERIATDLFLSKCALVKYFTGNFTKVPQILGFMDQEAVFFTKYLKPIAEEIAYSPDLSDEFGMEFPKSLIAEVRDLLINSSRNSSGELSDAAIAAMSNIMTDIVFVVQIDQTQRLLAANNDDKPIFYYHVSFNTNRSLHNLFQPNNTLEGAGHGDDLAYIFYFPAANYSNDPTDPVSRTIDRVSTMWTNFAKFGNPTPDWIDNNSLNVTWPNSGLTGLSLDIGYELTIGPRPINHDRKRLQLFSWPLLGLANGCACKNDLLFKLN